MISPFTRVEWAPTFPRSVVIGYLHIADSVVGPDETEPVLIVDSDAVLSLAVAGQCLQPVPRWNSQIVKTDRNIQLVQLA